MIRGIEQCLVLRVGDAWPASSRTFCLGLVTHPSPGAHCERSAREDSGHGSATKQSDGHCGHSTGPDNSPAFVPLGSFHRILYWP